MITSSVHKLKLSLKQELDGILALIDTEEFDPDWTQKLKTIIAQILARSSLGSIVKNEICYLQERAKIWDTQAHELSEYFRIYLLFRSMMEKHWHNYQSVEVQDFLKVLWESYFEKKNWQYNK